VSPEELERRADQVLARVPDWIWDGEELPVPVDDIADSCFGLLIREVEDMSQAPGAPEPAPGQAISGLLLAGPGEIWVNASEAREWPGRRRFTIGHELGHWCLHCEPGQKPLFCRKSAVKEDQDAGETQARAIEKEANIFAAALTMPRHLMQEHYERLKDEPDCHAQMCRLFNSSKAAMGRRLHTAI
jgi:hypothetical protein